MALAATAGGTARGGGRHAWYGHDPARFGAARRRFDAGVGERSLSSADLWQSADARLTRPNAAREFHLAAPLH
ncbi:hypothetical protein [Salinisphaera orenii]|uniref:Uncharacterized protein n=1 Tax=Salinisphaera orenii YIM 95161 TaxID=1051139 RepID=A0A423PXJ7_9GAMM|nr:hypothetical protein [Salinisphaera halophila]ROO30275.1 hypothetical protein SAHL_07940 [Salinisphaera halophila YIM 95161]